MKAKAQQPNILILMTHHNNKYGFQTPKIDAIVEQGISFTNTSLRGKK